MEVTGQDRLQALETVTELIGTYQAEEARLREVADKAATRTYAREFSNQADGCMVVLEKLEVVRRVIEDAANRRRRKREPRI